MDVDKDRDRCDTEGKQKALGELDATCVAKYFGLSSSQLGVDYSSFSNENLIDADPSSQAFATINNEDGIDELTIEQENVDIYTGEVTIAVHGFDKNDAIIYYDYSINGGEVFSELYEWPGASPLTNDNDGDFTVKITLGTGSTNPIVFRAYNQFDQDITSNTLTVNWNKDRPSVDPAIAVEDIPYQDASGENYDDVADYEPEITEDGGVVSEEEASVSEQDNKSKNSVFVKKGQLTGTAVFFIVAPFLIGITLAGLFLYKHMK